MAKPASDKDPAQLQFVFTRSRDGKVKAPFAGRCERLSKTRAKRWTTRASSRASTPRSAYGTRLNQGIAKLEANEKLSALAADLQGAKQMLKIQDANPNIDYDPGVELTLRLTAPLDWTGVTTGPEAKLQPFPQRKRIADLVNRQPFRTVAENPPRPSDMTNLMFIGTEAELRAAFEKAGWSSAARLNRSRSSKRRGR